MYLVFRARYADYFLKPFFNFVSYLSVGDFPQQHTLVAGWGWMEEKNKGSPFTAIVYDPSKVVASGDGLSHGVTGEKAEFTIRTEGAGPGKPVVKVMGPWRSVPCDVEEVDEHLYKCSYTPEEEGIHHINIVFADEDVPGSPFTAQVEEAIPVDARKVKVDGPHCPQMHRGPVSGVCDVSEAGDGQLTATCYSKKYGDVPVEVGPRENGNHQVLFNPPGKDVFHLSVLWSGDHVPGSPFDIDLNPPLANEVRVDGPHPCPDGIGPVHAYIDTSDAGDGVLDVKSSGERLGPVEVKVVEKDACVYDASFEAFQPDIYHMDVKWSGVHVPGSTFRIPIDLGEGLCTQEVLEDVESAYVPASFSDVYDSGESKEYQEPDIPESIPSFHIGEKLSVTMDKEGQGDAGHVTADCRGDTAGPVPVSMTKNSDGTYTATIDPRVPDLYTVNVLMDGEHVPSSPFKVRYLPPQTDATKCRVYNRPPPEKRLIAHNDIMYNVDASKAGAGDLTVQSEGPSGGKTNTNLQVVPKEGSDFKIIYTPTKAGTHKHYIYWSKEAIPNSPVEFEVSPRDIPVYPWSKVIGIDYEFLGLNPKDLSGHVIYQPTGKKLKLSVEKNKAEPEKAHVTFKPTDAGIYEIHILHHKNHVRGSPFEVHVLEPPNPNKVKVNGLEDAKCYVGDSVAFSVDCTEAGTGELLVKADSPSKDNEPSQLDIVDNHNNSYDGTYIPSTVGDHQLHVKWADQPVPGSPFTIKVQSDGSKEEIGTTNDPSKCFILPEDLEVMSTPFEHNQLVNFRVSTLNAGPGTLNVTSRGPSKADVVITDNKDGIYSVKFSPSEPGKYKLDVTWDDVNIKGSPCNIVVKGQRKSRVLTGLDLSNVPFRVGKPHKFKIHCDDLGDGPFDVQVEPPTDASITIRDLGKQTYHVTLVPKEPGVHKVSVLHSNQHILGSPFSCQFQQLGDASKCRLLEDAEEQQHEVGEEVSFMVTTEGAGPGTLSASVENVQKNTSRPADVKQLDETTYRVTFDPGQEEEYLLSIKYNNANIVGSPFRLSSSTPPDPTQCRAEGEGIISAQENKESTFVIITDGTNSDLKVEIEGSFEKVEPVISPPENGKYTVTYTPKFPGEYKIQVLWNDEAIPGSPFRVKSYSPSDPSSINLDKDTVKDSVLGKPFSFTVNSEPGNDGELTIVAHGPNKVVDGTIVDNGDGTFGATFDPPEPGKYMVHIRYNGQHINGSPFKVKVASPPIPEKVKAYGPGLEDGVVGREWSFVVETKEAGAGTLAVRVHGPKGAFKINMKRDPTSERTILVRYDPTSVGEYTVDITWSETHIPGSPFKVQVRPEEDKPE